MGKRFSKLTARMPKLARERARARTQAMAAELTLAELNAIPKAVKYEKLL
jgi:hypothetical protein